MRQATSRQCQRCGTCCQVDFSAFVTKADIARWQTEGRKDILQVLEHEDAVWMGDHLVSRSGEQDLHSCPFLHWDDGRFSCAIYQTRPRTCREFQPGSSPLCPQYTRPIRDVQNPRSCLTGEGVQHHITRFGIRLNEK